MSDKELDIMLDQLRRKDYPKDGFQSRDQFKASFFEKAAEQDKKERIRFKYVMVSFLSAAACLVIAIVFIYQGLTGHAKTAPAEQDPCIVPENNAIAAVQDPAKPESGANAVSSEPVPGKNKLAWQKKLAQTIQMKKRLTQSKERKAVTRRKKTPSYAQKYNTAGSRLNEDNPFLKVRTNPCSTFAANMDIAYYINLRRLLKNGEKTDRNVIRTEELLNYFNYDYTEPKDGEKFAVDFEMMDAPWNTEHKLLLVGIQAKKIDMEKVPPSNFVFLIDHSGSMRNYMDLVRESMAALADTMRPQDTISIVTCGGGANVLLQGVNGEGKNKQEIRNMLDNIISGGDTPVRAGMQKAYELAHKYFVKDGNNRIVLITDGDFNMGDSIESELVSTVEKERQNAIYLTVVNVGEDNYEGNKLEMLAKKGNGNYLYWDSAQEACISIVSEMTGSTLALAKDVKFQLEMNPAKIHSYRQIGYEARNPDDDAKDSCEIGLGQQITVLYELVMADKENRNDVDTLLKRQENKSSCNAEFLTCKIRYREPEGNSASVKRMFVLNEIPTDKNNIHWAASVAEFALIMRNSPHKGNADLKTLHQRAQQYLGEDSNGKRTDFLKMIRDAENVR